MAQRVADLAQAQATQAQAQAAQAQQNLDAMKIQLELAEKERKQKEEEESSPYPKHWGPPPSELTKDLCKLPGNYGWGSGTLARWISHKLAADKW